MILRQNKKNFFVVWMTKPKQKLIIQPISIFFKEPAYDHSYTLLPISVMKLVLGLNRLGCWGTHNL